MNYFDPSRPKVGDRPALLWEGKPIGAIPSISVTPTPGLIVFALEVCIVIAPSTGRWLHSDTTSLEAFIHNFTLDPEAVLQQNFNWSYNASALRESRSLSITDLGDLDE